MRRKDLSFPPIEPGGMSLKEGLKWVAVGLIVAHLSFLTLPITKSFFSSSQASDKTSVCSIEDNL